MCALTIKKRLKKKKKRTDFPELFKRRDGYFLRPPKAMQPVQWKNIELEKTHRILKIEKKNDLIDISLNIAEDPEGGRRDFGGDCALERFVAVWGVHGKIGVALVHFSIYYCYPFSIFFFKTIFLCCARRRSRRVCAEFNSKSGDR